MRIFSDRMLTALCSIAVLAAAPSTLAQPWSQVEKLRASNASSSDYFGEAVAIDDTTAIVGALTADGRAANSGAAYIFDRDQSGAWIEIVRLSADSGQAFDWFGYSVSIAGDLAAVGAPFAAGNENATGAAYVFRRDPFGVWAQQGTIIAPDGVQDDLFGHSVAIAGTRMLVGAPQAEGNDYQSGAVYIFSYSSQNQQWVFSQRLTASDGEAYDLFGTSVGYKGGWAVIGSPQDGDQGYASGSAYVFGQQGGGGLDELAKLQAVGGGEADFFGQSVDIKGSRVLIGAPSDDDRGSNAGAAYIFDYSTPNHEWIQTAKLLADDGQGNDQFGIAVSLDQDRAAVGAYWEGTFGTNEGAAYVFALDPGGAWAQEQKLVAADRETGDWFGNSVGLSGDAAIVGMPNDDDHGDRSGSAYIFEREPVGPTIDVSGSCPGPMQLLISGATPRGQVALIAGFRNGNFTLPTGPCQGLVIGIRPPFAPGMPFITRADSSGQVPFARNVPAQACGLSVQAVDGATCTASNVAELR